MPNPPESSNTYKKGLIEDVLKEREPLRGQH